MRSATRCSAFSACCDRRGYDSEIFVETADPRLEAPDARLSRSGRRDVAAGRRADPSLFDRIARVADGVRGAEPDDPRVPQHHAAAVFPGRARWLVRQCYHGRRELRRLSIARRSRARRLGVQPARTGGARIRADRRAAARSPTSRTSTWRPIRASYDAFDDDDVNILFVGRLIPNKRPDNLIRYVHAYRTVFEPTARLLLAGSHAHFENYLRRAARVRGAAGRARRAHARTGHQRRTDGALRRRRCVPVRERARRILRAHRRGVLQARAGRRARRHGGAGDDGWRRRVCTTRTIRWKSRD